MEEPSVVELAVIGPPKRCGRRLRRGSARLEPLLHARLLRSLRFLTRPAASSGARLHRRTPSPHLLPRLRRPLLPASPWSRAACRRLANFLICPLNPGIQAIPKSQIGVESERAVPFVIQKGVEVEVIEHVASFKA